MKFKETLPEFYDEVFALLGEKASDLLQQLPNLNITGRCKCGQFECSTFAVNGGRSPVPIEQHAERGQYLTTSIDLDASVGVVVVDLDHLRRIQSFEILNREDIHERLQELFKL